MKAITKKELEAFRKITLKYENNYNEIYDALYHYMKTYCNDNLMESYMFKDEIEDLIGIREHDDIINYINKKLKD